MLEANCIKRFKSQNILTINEHLFLDFRRRYDSTEDMMPCLLFIITFSYLPVSQNGI